jgi:hypothetical protein
MWRCFARQIGVFLSLATIWAGSLAASEPMSREYKLLRTMPKEIISQYLPAQFGTIIKGRGGCRYLAASAVLNDKPRADDAWKSIEAMFSTQVEDGGFEGGGKPGDAAITVFGVRVENAYFFLQEVGRAILVVQASPLEPYFRDRFAAMRPKLRRACDFIQKGYSTIILKVGHTPNRLLIAAKAFGLCGIVLDDESMKENSSRLVKAALARRDKGGVFIERSGRDSSYNAVAILMGQHLSLYLPNAELDAAMKPAMDWQRTRVKPTGEVEVEGNTRTGVGKELSPEGVPKNINYNEVAQALWYYGALRNEPDVIDLALKVQAWHDTHHL